MCRFFGSNIVASSAPKASQRCDRLRDPRQLHGPAKAHLEISEVMASPSVRNRVSCGSRSTGDIMKLSSWILATRPRTLSLSTMPVIVGAVLAWAVQGQLRWPALLGALLGSTLIHLATNLHNDATGSKRGGDGPDRFGPPRATASGLLAEATVNTTAFACFAAAGLIGCYLIWVGGWPIFLLGVASILAGWCYNGGPLPIAYTPLGELFVVAFFGISAVCGTYWLGTANINAIAVEAGLALGCFAAAVLLINNQRDVKADARVGRKTLAIVAGPRATKWIYAALMLVPFGLLIPMGSNLPRGHVWPALILLPLVGLLINQFMNEPPGHGLNRILGQTVQIQALFSLLFSLGLIL
jgi:1,4-dihydroxy-2-naphthoate polyprenyltransferase